MAKDERVYRTKVPVPPKKIYQVKIFEEDNRQKLEKKINNWLKKNENISSVTIKCVHTHHEKGQKYSVIIKYRTEIKWEDMELVVHSAIPRPLYSTPPDY